MSSTSDRTRLLVATTAYLGGSLALLVVGLALQAHWLEMVGFLLIAGTFIPLPYDLYVLHVLPRFPFWTLIVAASVLNTVGVLAERWFLLRLMEQGRGRRVRDTVAATRLSRWFLRAPFWVVFVSGFTVIPFEPARFLAVVNGYGVGRYAFATFVGRGLRFWMLVAAGGILERFDLLGWALLVMVVVYLATLLLADLRRFGGIWARSEVPDEVDEVAPAEPTLG